jgi:DNA-binding CsgD family transcriptional regulator
MARKTAHLEGDGRALTAPTPTQLALLTKRELEVFRMIGEQQSTVKIAYAIHRSPKTVETHRENIKRKLGLRDNTALVASAALHRAGRMG